MASKVWGHAFFREHPAAKVHPKDRRAFATDKLTLKKTFCNACYDVAFRDELMRDEEEVRTGMRTAKRDTQAIEAFLWSDPPPGTDHRKWISSRPENIHRHLKNCLFQPPAVRDQAARELVRANLLKSPSRPATSSGHSFQVSLPQGSPSLPQPLFQTTPFSARPSPLALPMDSFPIPFPSVSPTVSIGNLSSVQPSSQSPSPLLLSVRGYSPQIPSPLSIPSQSGYYLDIDSTNSRKRPRHSSGKEVSRQNSFTDFRTTWTVDNQISFGIHLARITASCGFPYRWIENPEVLSFLDEFLPKAKRISRRQISDTLIPQEVAKYRELAKQSCYGTLATIQCDGWSGINFHHFLAFMITTSNREVHTVKVFDTSTERKTADNLLGEIRQVVALLSNDWHVTVVAMTSDAAGEAKKARRLLLEAEPSLIAPDCWAHQNALVVGDYMRVKDSHFLQYAEQANIVIAWLRSKTQILGLMRDTQEAMRATNPTARVLSVIRPVVTRWTAFYLAYTRLLELHWVLMLLVTNNLDRLTAGSAAARRKALEVVRIIQTPTFWTGLTRIKKHLEPLARSSCILQAAHARLDQVPIVFGSLLREYQAMATDLDIGFGSEDLLGAIESSIERRWKSSDQDVYIAAIVLHPLLKTRPFAQIPLIAPINLWEIIQHLWKRFYNADAPHVLFTELNNYLQGRGIYAKLVQWATGIKVAAEAEGEVPDPIKMFDGVRFSVTDTPLVQLATRIHAICCNSASCERLFSMYGNILTKHRARLHAQKMTDQAELRLHLRDEHLRLELEEKAKKRHTTSHQPPLPSDQDPQSSTASQSHLETPQINPPATPAAPPISPEESSLLDAVNDAAGTSTTNRFSGIYRDLTEASEGMEAEDLEDDPPERIATSTATLAQNKTPLSTLFDFSNEYWAGTSVASKSLDDELELYQLLDIDADGDPDNYEEGNDISHPTMM